MNKTLTNTQIAFIVFSYIVGYGVISLPKDIAKDLGTSGWISIIIGDIVILFSAYLFIYLAKTFNNKTIFEYSKILTGKFISYCIILFISVYSISVGSMITRLSSETIKLSFLINTPVWALSLLMTLVSFYTLINDIKVLGKIFEIFAIIVIIMSLAIHFGIFTQGELTNLKPFFALDMDSFLKTLPKIIFPFVGIEILAVLPMDVKKKNKRIFKHISFMVIFIGILYVIVVESCISVMGVESIIHYEDALFATIRRIEIDYLQFLKRLDSIFIIAWLLVVYGTIVLGLYMAIFLLNNLFANINRNIIVFIVTFISFILCLIPSTMDSLRKILEYISYSGIIVLLVIPLILCILTLIKKHYKKL